KKSNCRRRIMKSLDISYKKILKGYEYIDKKVNNNKHVIQAAEWLLDNLYLIQREYEDVKVNMPESYYKNLPIMSKGIMKGYPRIYYIAVELVSHTDGAIDEETIETFISVYQKNTILTSGELWALPIMIRIALIQNISKIIERIVFAQKEIEKGDILAERLIDAVNNNTVEDEIKKLYFEDIIFTSHMVERVLKVLRDNETENTIIYKWIDEKLDNEETNLERMINIEHQKQAGYQISIGNSITGIREVGTLNWKVSFEKLSYVENILRKDPFRIYENMDFQSRDYYRHSIEKLAKCMNVPESLIAKRAIECALEAKNNADSEKYEEHVGYYIIDHGIESLKKKISFEESKVHSIKSKFIKGNVNFYIGTIIFSTILLVSLILVLSYYNDERTILWQYIIAGIAILIPCSEIVVSTFNWSINKLIEPRFVPKIEFRKGIPVEASTIVVIPTLLPSETRVKELISDMEVYYLANKEENIYFGILGDFKDSVQKEEKDDRSIVDTALKLIKALNDKYSKNGIDIFYFFNRYRQYNEKEGIWLGWERKRGKLMEFNELIKGSKNTSYDVVSGNVENLYNIKYVITLDADTQLPRDSAKRLIGSMYHILNKPYIDSNNKVVLRGHGLMQPRIGVGTLSANKTMFSKIFSGEVGIDMYTTAISDVYEDLFDEGIFTGKGIYDVDTFNNILSGEIPENSVLSHDLLEGSYIRAALVTDIELIDGYPAYYNSSCKRIHRWTRGDWQLLPWIFKKNHLNKLSRWKVFDNLRRSLLAPSIMILIILALLMFKNPDRWLAIAFISILCPILFDVSETVISPIKGIGLSGKLSNGKNVLEQVFLIFCFLPHQAYLMIDAIIRTLYRLSISKKNFLQWQTAEDAEKSSGRSFIDFVQFMWVASAVSVFIAFIAFQNSLDSGMLIMPSAIIWFTSPWIAYSISRETKREKHQLTNEQEEILRRVTRKTWSYFEDFVNEENNWLAPDNYQEDPHNGVAHRTSPTNIGMGLTSNIVAVDFGYIGILEFQQRMDKIVSNMESLEKFKGHFYNWYDTETKNPLYPKYISTVDSGNLIGYLWLTNETINEYMSGSVVKKSVLLAVTDNLKLASYEIKSSSNIEDFYIHLIHEFSNKDFNILSWKNTLESVWTKCMEISKVKECTDLYWNNKLKYSISKYLNEIQVFFPWADMLLKTPEKLEFIKERLTEIPTESSLKNLPKEIEDIQNELNEAYSKFKDDQQWISEINLMLESGKYEITTFLSKLISLRERLSKIAESTDFRMLYDEKRQLFSIGYDVENDSINKCYYDLLASEARQASFVAIAKGDIEKGHWFKLGRSLTMIGKDKGLVSWTGTMFEYLMPFLIMKAYPDTLLYETYRAVVGGQEKYGKERKVPWGISESAFYNFDVNLNYQYKAFGVPGIGLKRGLMTDLVISPYSTVMALQIDLKKAFNNIKKLIDIGMEGIYGFYESIDYTKERLPKGKRSAKVKCFMVHHQGMSLMSLDNVINDSILQERFHRIPRVKATELLLQEKKSKNVVYDREQQYEDTDIIAEKQNLIARRYNIAKTEMPETHIMSNGKYSLMITNSGAGYAKKDDMTVYRWREDTTTDSTGMFFYIKNLNSGEYWGTAYEPCKSEGDEYNVTFSLDKAEFERKDGNIKTHTQVTVSNEDNAEVRKISLTNQSDHSREIEITSYCEITLAPYNADLVHPSFGNLFIKTEFVDEAKCIVANRRPRSKDSKQPWVMQTIAVEGNLLGSIQYETSRANFIGRGRDLSNPEAMDNNVQLKMTSGAVLDPIISIRVRVKIEKGESCKIAFTTATADSRQEAIELSEKYRDMHNVNRIFELSWTEIQVEMKYLGIKSPQANTYQLMASKILFLNTLFRDREKYIKHINKGQSALWAYGISGDLPIVLLIVRDDKNVDIVRQLLNAHEYWNIKGLKVDLVILNLQNASYTQNLQDSIRDLINSSYARDKQNKSGGVFLHSKATIKEEDVDLLMAIARLVIDGDKGSVASQIKHKEDESRKEAELLKVQPKNYSFVPSNFDIPKLYYFNGLGGFHHENNSYIIVLKNWETTPAPWINVISNDSFGFHVSESGISYTWNKNSRENKLTTWSNDPIIDGEAEQIYVRDENTGDLWSISPKPIRDSGEYIIEHGFGYSNFKHEAYGIMGEMTMFVDVNESVKLCRIKLKNNTNEKRKLSISYYAKLVLGVTHEQSAQYIFTEFNKEKGYMYALNPYSEHFGKLICYLKTFGGKGVSFTGDRKEFLGRGGSVREPEAMKFEKLSDTVGAGFDPCLAENVKINLDKKEEKYILIALGQGETFEEVERVVKKYNNEFKAEDELNNTKNYWQKLLNTIQVKTPDKSMDILLNGWLMYQILSCRFWSRTAFYQSGGAYGFRDQLQDVMAINYVDNNIPREHIIYSASKQYLEGDVQHWWHPIVDSGIRTRFSDDLLWLPYVTTDYIQNTGDYNILDEEAGYLEDEPLKEGEDERYNIAKISQKKGTIYEHCIKAIERGLKFGSHNIPLMGSGDWNDGMSTVGNKGKGESVWLGWFLYSILDKFIPICEYKSDFENVAKYNELKEFIRENLEKNAWDGSWYRRAYFDDGTPLGSINNDECQIDSLSQSWAIISGAGKESRVKEAMNALEKNLVKEDKGIILLLTPAFDKSSLEPGYIKGYVPGVRENGGQYTHGSIWVILALTKMGYNNKAWNLFNMINPINHAESRLECQTYKVEPYVMTADVYTVDPHVGRGGWSWYTGAAGWMYRTGVEGILGLKFRKSEGFTIEPCIPDEWDNYDIYYNLEKCKYSIQVKRGEKRGLWVDGNKIDNKIIPFFKDGDHKVKVVI
ncbi:GH36-type glycosyl hydrolase domain-containing protein, partial [Clostridium muellerianum]|uniref:GH36-type glycosyl hydrolase domain-containing protein n=1 Tax=Clostridium muellerianum TaxID=2716538 RepID=UPI001981F9D3